jgi:hypothetical protein
MSQSPSNTPQQAPEGHEQMDVSGSGFLIFAILFIAGLGSTTLFLIWLLRTLAAGTPAEPSSALSTRIFPQGPQLQASIIHPAVPEQDMVRLRAYHKNLLESYGWVDRKNEVVRVPVERAMRVFLERGAPAEPFRAGSGAASSTAPAQTGGAP